MCVNKLYTPHPLSLLPPEAFQHGEAKITAILHFSKCVLLFSTLKVQLIITYNCCVNPVLDIVKGSELFSCSMSLDVQTHTKTQTRRDTAFQL